MKTINTDQNVTEGRKNVSARWMSRAVAGLIGFVLAASGKN